MKNILMFIPGFRSGKRWKMIVSSLYYLIALTAIFDSIGMFLTSLVVPFLVFSIKDLIKKRDNTSKMAAAVSLVIFLIGAFITPPTETKQVKVENKRITSTNEVAKNEENTESKEKTGQSKPSISENNTAANDDSENADNKENTSVNEKTNKTDINTDKVTADSNKTTTEEGLKVHFIDVGQADSILIQQGNNFMLVDAGNNADHQTVVNYLNNQGVTELQAFIGTHKDEDHIGAADYVINSFKVGKVYFPKQTATTENFKDFVLAVKNKGLGLTVPKVGESFSLGQANVKILAPNSSNYEDSNDYSIVLKITYGKTSFLLTGDAESVSENEMTSNGLDLSATVLKVGHHGSKTSTSQEFLNKVNPKYAVISVGEGNSYGHPAQDTMNRLKAEGITVYRTDESGTIVASSNGNEVKFSVKPGSYNGIASNSTKTSSSEVSSGSKAAESVSSSNTVNEPAAPAKPIVQENQFVDSNGNGLIKGNISSTGEKIYHLPGGAYYDKTNAEEYFKTEAEAKAAGYRPSKR